MMPLPPHRVVSVLARIGYSTCHWCHVLAHERFDDESVAEVGNQNLFSIEVDGEEGPPLVVWGWHTT